MKVQRTISDPEPWPLHVPSSVRLGPGGVPRAVRGEVFTGRCPQGARYKPKSDPEIGRSSQRGHLERTPQPFQDPGVLGVGGEGSG